MDLLEYGECHNDDEEKYDYDKFHIFRNLKQAGINQNFHNAHPNV